jgi:hypothetical protein
MLRDGDSPWNRGIPVISGHDTTASTLRLVDRARYVAEALNTAVIRVQPCLGVVRPLNSARIDSKRGPVTQICFLPGEVPIPALYLDCAVGASLRRRRVAGHRILIRILPARPLVRRHVGRPRACAARCRRAFHFTKGAFARSPIPVFVQVLQRPRTERPLVAAPIDPRHRPVSMITGHPFHTRARIGSE